MVHISQTLRAAFFFIFGISLIWIVYETFSESGRHNGSGYEIRASFQNLKQLKAGSDVRLAGVRIGTVSQIYLDKGQAIAMLVVDAKYDIPKDSYAIITTAGLLGHNYISINIGKSQNQLSSGDLIETRNNPDINEVFGEIADMSKKIESFVEDFICTDNSNNPKTIFTKLSTLLEENAKSLHQTTQNIEQITNKLANNEGALGKLISDEEAYTQGIEVLRCISSATKRMDALVKDIHDITLEMKAGSGAIGLLLNDKQTEKQIREALANINLFSQKINNKNSTIGRLTSDTDLYNRAEAALRKVENAVESMENSGPISAAGIVAGSLF